MIEATMKKSWLLALACSFALTGQAADAQRQIEVPAGDLLSAIEVLQQQSDVQVVYNDVDLKGLTTTGVRGALTTQEAVRKLLEGTKLRLSLDQATGAMLIVKEGIKPTARVGEEGAALRLAQVGDSEKDSTGSVAAPADERGELEEVIVTAQKREERLQDVPLSISAVSGADLARRDIKDAVDLSFAVPGLGAFQVSPGKNLLQIRGISGFRGAGPLIGIYMDEIPLSGGIRLSDGTGLDAQTIDLARVEVLKGPQGTLFGEGAMGGVIRYVTNDPQLDHLEGRVSTSFFNTQDGAESGEVVGVLSVPLVTDKLGVRIVGTHQRNGGWLDNVSTGEEDFNDNRLTDVRAKVLYVPTEELSLSALVNIHRLDVGGQNIVNVTPYERSQFRQAVYPDYPTDGYNDFNLYNVTASYDFGFATLLSSTSHFNLESDSYGGWQTQIVPGEGEVTLGGWEFLTNNGRGEQVVTSQELRLASNSRGPLKWLIGGNYKHTKNEYFANDPTDTGFLFRIPGSVPTVAIAAGDYGDNVSKVTTAFTDVSYTFFDRLEAGGGARVFKEELSNKHFDPAGVPDVDEDGTFEKTTYRIFARYRLNDHVNLYANTASGFRSGGFNAGPAIAQGAPPSFDPESSIFYEAGVKTVFLNGRLALDVAAFKGRYEDQVQNALITDPVTNVITTYSSNIGVADLEGVEWQLSVSPVRGLQFVFSGDVLDTKFTKVGPDAPVVVGDPLDFVPEYTLVLSGNYEFDWAPRVPGYVDISYSRKGKQKNMNRGTDVGYEINENSPLDFLQASIGAELNGFELSVFGKNLLDERGILNPQFSGITPQARPRTVGISIGKSF